MIIILYLFLDTFIIYSLFILQVDEVLLLQYYERTYWEKYFENRYMHNITFQFIRLKNFTLK